jgi:hypothetical protein
MNRERKEALMRIPVLIVSGIILGVWKWLIFVFFVANFAYTLVKKKRHRELAELSETWNTQWYAFQKYMIFLSNRRPFPFAGLGERMGKFES